MHPRLSSALSLFGAAALALGCGAAMALAQTVPGTEVVNTAQVTWQMEGMENVQILTPQARFVVARPPSDGVLTAWERDQGTSALAPQLITFAAADYRRNPFVPMPEPVDSSALTGNPNPIDRTAPLPVVRAERIRLGVPLFFTLEDSGLNRDPAQIDTAVVVVTDSVTGDREELRFYETGPDTGVFSGWLNTATQSAPGDGQLSTAPLSMITAKYEDATNAINDLAIAVMVGPIDPSGVIFDSRTGAPVSGIEITLIDTATGQPAVVLGDDMVARYPSTLVTGGQVTDASGRRYQMEPGAYRFPFVMPGTYRIVVTPSDDYGYIAPSRRGADALQDVPGAPFVLRTGSLLEPFAVVPGMDLRLDIPMDPLAMTMITRSASQSEAAIGEFIEYAVTVTVDDAVAITVEDVLPDAVVFLPGTMLVNGAPVVPQVTDNGRRLTYNVPAQNAGEVTTITYGAQITAPARAGQVLRSTSTLATDGLRRAEDEHDLRIRDALGLDQVAILGQISAGGCGMAETDYDLSGIRVLLENGEFAMTDSDGRFTFRDIYRRPRVVQMDVTTLPTGTRPVLCYAGTRSAGSAISQFVALRPGMMGRVEFYLAFDDIPEVAEAATAPAPDAIPAATPESSPLVRFDRDWLDANGASHGAGFLAPADGFMPRSTAIDLVYLRPVGATSDLTVNDEEVPAIRREPAIRSSDGKWEMIRYRAVRIEAGRNALSLVITGADGQVLRRDNRDVLYGLRPAQMALIRSASVLESDGRSHPQITLRLTDSDGIPIRPGTQVTVMIDAPFGFSPSDPARRSQPGSSRGGQSRITETIGQDGTVALTLAPVLEGGTARLRIPSTDHDLTLSVPISAANRPWVLVGLAEGTLAHDQVRAHMRREGEIGNALSGRVSLFAEGVIRGEWLLTLRYDSAQDGDEFYGIDPDADYIVYGDRSVQGNATQSRFPLYLRLRKEGAEYLVGDFNTDLNDGGVTINQNVTGARAVFEDERFRVMAFAAQGSNRLVEDRIPLNGTIGPYALSQADVIPNSQTIRLVTVSRFDASEELSSRTLVAGVDYVVSYTTGQFFLRRPIPAFTADLDRNVLVIDYEADADLRNALIAGIRAEREISARLRMGATGVYARRVDGQDVSVTLGGIDVTYQATDALSFSADVLVARRNFATFTDTGLRSEIRAEFERDTTQFAAYLRRQTGNVALSADRRDIDTTIAGLTFRHQLSATRGDTLNRWLVEGGLLAENDMAGAQRRADGEILLTRERDFTSQSIGFRGLRQTDGDDVRLVTRGTEISEDERYSKSAELQSSLRPDGARAADQLTFGLGFGLTEEWSLFSTFELESLRNADTEARRFTLGADYTPREGRIYRGALSMAGNDADGGQALFLGADHAYTLREGVSATLGSDVQWDMGAADVPIGQSIGNPYIADSFATVRAGLRYEAEGWGTGVDVEAQRSRTSETGNLRLRIDGELSETWSAGAEAFLGLTRDRAEVAKQELRLEASAAHRAGPRDPITLLQAALRQRNEGEVDSLTAISSLYRSQYLSDTEFLNLRLGVKYDQAELRTGAVDDVLTLIGAEYRRDLTELVDIGFHGSAIYAARSGRTRQSLGISLGLTPFENGWLSVGYNFIGFDDPDFSTLGHTDKGAFAQFRLKFDADSLRGMFR
ncbi:MULTISPECIES: hypothetical protein [unclassified Yoonia]|uniref:hypothetical protein n=1 Tax=unclassified Yoonia TaxID=2629118 RepID=UPI002AFE8A11|nr:MULTISPECIES: hypothetical protein [unclassified Yoonia]